MEVANTQPFYNMASVTVVKSFIVPALGLFTRRDSNEEKSFITLAAVVNLIKLFLPY